MRVDELSIGDYVLNGGEAAALVVVEAVVRLLPGVIGNPESLHEESHSAQHAGLLGRPGLHQAAGVARANRSRGAARAATTPRSGSGDESRP